MIATGAGMLLIRTTVERTSFVTTITGPSTTVLILQQLTQSSMQEPGDVTSKTDISTPRLV